MIEESTNNSAQANSSDAQEGDRVLDSSELQSDVGEPNCDQPEDSPWDMVPDEIDAGYITSQIPRALWDGFIWEAVRAAIPGSETKDDVIRKVKLWNTHNRPQIPEADLVRKVLWALRTFDDSPWKRFS